MVRVTVAVGIVVGREALVGLGAGVALLRLAVEEWVHVHVGAMQDRVVADLVSQLDQPVDLADVVWRGGVWPVDDVERGVHAVLGEQRCHPAIDRWQKLPAVRQL